MTLPDTPLERAPGTRPLFLKREDLLPFGGGNKVRRLLDWLGDAVPAVGVLSDFGSHTFVALAHMHAHGLVGPLVLWERASARTPYAEKNAAIYADQDGIEVRRGVLPWLLLQMAWARVRRGPRVLGIGGTVRNTSAYDGVFGTCLDEVDTQVDGAAVWHLCPVASGSMIDGFLRVLRRRDATRHRILAVLTGPPSSRRAMRLRYARDERVALTDRPLSPEEAVHEALVFEEQTGVRVDPRHMAHAVALLRDLPPVVGERDAVVVWITSPHQT